MNNSSNLIDRINVSIDDHCLEIDVVYPDGFCVDLNDIESLAPTQLTQDGIFPTDANVNMNLIAASEAIFA